MKANELRIGNYIWLESKQKEYQISSGHDIEEIDDAPLNFDAKPIPLTREWLLKFRFVEKIDAYFYNDYCIEDIHNGVTWVISEFDHITDEFTAIGRGINYVHQLQNLYFALTGEELTFKSE